MKKNEGIYAPYLSWNSNDNFEFLKDHLLHCAKCTSCHCYWPESNKEAAIISDTGYKFFTELFKITALSLLVENEIEQKKAIFSRPQDLSKFSNRGLVIALTCKCFLYSHFYRLCQDLDQYSKITFNDKEYAIIKNQLEIILKELAPPFIKIYERCYLKHPSRRLLNERKFISTLDFSDTSIMCTGKINTSNLENSDYSNNEFFYYHYEESAILKEKFIREEVYPILDQSQDQKQKAHNFLEFKNNRIDQISWLKSQILLQEGTFLNELMLYSDAIKLFSKAIKVDPSNKDAYIERALAYFEINQLSLALKDYEITKKLIVTPPFKIALHRANILGAVYVPENKIEFSKGLITGTLEGMKISTVEFIPSAFSCCRGILSGLWAFTCSPLEVSNELINSTYALGEFISTHSHIECLHCVIPELRELSLTWNKLNDSLKGQKIGYIIGKYGVEIFAPIAVLQGVTKIRAISRANTMCTLESCIFSELKRDKILEESLKRAILRESSMADALKNGGILVKNSNTYHHVMQKKHA